MEPPYTYLCRVVLETIPYSMLESVHEEEPITGDTLIFNLGVRVSNLACSSEVSMIVALYSQQIYASSLLRKEKLVKFFKSLNLYLQDVRLPANVCVHWG